MTAHTGNQNQAIQSQFGEAAANYTTSVVHATGLDLTHMADLLNLPATAHILDAGSGAGHASFAAAPRVGQVTAYDLTGPMLAQVQQNATARHLTNITATQGDVVHLPFADACFDAVVSRYSAHHWLNPQMALHEFRRVIKPEGQVIMGDVIAPDDHASDTFLQTIELLRDPSHVRDHRVSEWLHFFEEAGFKAEVSLNFDIHLHFGDWLARINTPPHYAEAIRHLMTGAPAEIKALFNLPARVTNDTFTFTIQGAVIIAYAT